MDNGHYVNWLIYLFIYWQIISLHFGARLGRTRFGIDYDLPGIGPALSHTVMKAFRGENFHLDAERKLSRV
jgi:hypothetical protein